MNKTYISTESRAHQTIGEDHTAWILVRTFAFPLPGSNNELGIRLYQYLPKDKKLEIFDGSIIELMELVLLGKERKDQLQKETKCDLCNEPAKWFESPLGNSDEAQLCDRHFNNLSQDCKNLMKPSPYSS